MFSGIYDLPWWGYVIYTLVVTHITIACVTIYLHRHQAHRAHVRRIEVEGRLLHLSIESSQAPAHDDRDVCDRKGDVAEHDGPAHSRSQGLPNSGCTPTGRSTQADATKWGVGSSP